MTEFNLTNGQAIKLTKDGIWIKGDYISLEGSITIVKNDTTASIMEETKERVIATVVSIKDEETSKDKTIEDVTATLNDRVSKLEAKVTTLVGDIDLKLISERAKTDQKIADAVVKSKVDDTPHVRIEFDHINDIPTIFIDGDKVQGGLVSLNVDWKTNTENHVKKTFEVKVINKDGYGTTIGENSLI
ncbi:hypothetical protein [Leuconostoc mesenteroides]|uniref:hypothetical protein n=1 Tax=Leuconostoc mesenteroides TaxID=1245 RepID=UPI001CC12430|nr:hypothetical protein [Leuconostoc mesenteroides]MBZ1508867.1 hypothetical protein [Leuconostoc mesenteroides]MBZ1532785.1 hypothetical protein [Leuconostoc mesenteroides]